MNSNLYKTSASTARALGAELHDILDELDTIAAQPLVDRLTTNPHAAPLLVFTGYHSSGKSTLINALTDRAFDIPVGSGVTTDRVTEYVWDGDIRLVDTPGVHAGRPNHDDLAEQALQAADLVVFAVPVELFDDTLVTHLHDVLGRLGKARQTLIVVTKAGTMDAAPGVRESEIIKALGPFDPIPWVECDAGYYLDGLDLASSSPDDSAAFIQASALDTVADRINSFAAEQGELGKLSQPFQLIIALSLEASSLLTDNPDEQAALGVLARQRSALSRKRLHLDSLIEAKAAQFRSEAVRAATRLADDIEAGETEGDASNEAALDKQTAALNRRLDTALGQFRQSVEQVLELQFDDLASEVMEIEASPFGRVAVQLGEVQTHDFMAPEVDVRAGRPPLRPLPTWAKDLSGHLKQFQSLWGAGSGTKAASGSNGHQIVLKAGHAFGKKFAPWEAARTANTIGKVAKVGGIAIAVGLEAYGVFADERAAVKAELARAERRRRITQEVVGQADAIVSDSLHRVADDLDEVFGPEIDRIDTMAGAIQDARTARSDHRDRLVAVQQRARAALDLLLQAANGA